MKKITYLTLLLTLLFGISCNSFLDIHPDGEKIENDIFDSPQGFENTLYGVYASMNSEDLYGKNCSFYINDILAQYYFINSKTHLTFKMSNFEYLDNDVRTMVTSTWVKMYETIGYVNNIIKNLDERNEAKSYPLYNVYYAEALGLRAFMHFELTRYFSENILQNSSAIGIPYRDKYNFNITEFDPLSTTYNKILADLERAEKLYGDQEYFKNDYTNTPFLKDRSIHMNLYAIRAIMSRVYWTMGNLEKASEYALKVIDSEQFELIKSEELEEFVGGILSKKETIWGIFSDKLHKSTLDYLYYTQNGEKGLSLKPYEPTYQLDKDGVDYRLEKWFKNIQNTNVSGNRCMKIIDNYKLTGASRKENAISGINMIRLPELYYIVSEYYVSIGRLSEANKYLDMVVKSRGLKPFAERGVDVSLSIINNERRKEYIAEGQYFFVMKRYNMDVFESGSGKTYPGSKGIYVFPLPDNEIDYRN